MSDSPHPAGGTDNPDVSRERSDVNVRGIVLTAVGLAVVTILTHLAAWWLLVVLERRREASGPPPSPWAQHQRGQLPPVPLEGIERMEKGEAGKEEVGAEPPQPPKSYASVDDKLGIVQIPLERAMQLIVEHDLLKTELAPRSNGPAGSPPSDANSGRGRQEGAP
jgi:hypothetical protein